MMMMLHSTLYYVFYYLQILQQAIRTLKEGDDADHTNGYGPITNFEKAVTDVGFALNILEMMSSILYKLAHL